MRPAHDGYVAADNPDGGIDNGAGKETATGGNVDRKVSRAGFSLFYEEVYDEFLGDDVRADVKLCIRLARRSWIGICTCSTRLIP